MTSAGRRKLLPFIVAVASGFGCAETNPEMVPETGASTEARPPGAPQQDDRMSRPPPPGPLPADAAQHPGGKPPPPPFARPSRLPPSDPGPPVAATRDFNPSRPTLTALPGGLTLAVIERHELPFVDVRLVLDAGNAADPADRAGLARLTAALVAHGTRTRSRDQIADQIELAGGELAIDTTADTTTLGARVLADQLDVALATLADLVRNPTFTAAAVDEELHRGIEELEAADSQGAVVAARTVERLVFATGPYGHTPSRSSLSAITGQDVVRFHAAHYRPEGATLIVVGDVASAALAARVKRAFGGWKGVGKRPASATGVPAISAVSGAAAQTVHLVPVVPSPSVRVAVAWPVAPPSDAAAATSLLVLSQAVDAALAHHHVTGYLERHRQGSMFAVAVRVPRERAAETLRTLLALAEHLRAGGLSDAEIEHARQRVEGSFLLTLDRPEGLAHLVELGQTWHLQPEAWETFRGRVRAVDRASIASVAKQYLDPAHAEIVVVGDVDLEPELAQIAPVVKLDENGLAASH